MILIYILIGLFLLWSKIANRSAFSTGCVSGLEFGREISKSKLQENTLFNINSTFFNLENNKEEILNKYNCFYNPSLEALCILVEKNMRYVDLSKEIIINFIDFAQRMNIKNLIMLLDRKNKDYVKVLQSMMTVGFSNDKNLSVIKIAEINYKVLVMAVSIGQKEIEEIVF